MFLKDALHIVSVVLCHYLGYHKNLFLRFSEALKMLEQKKITDTCASPLLYFFLLLLQIYSITVVLSVGSHMQAMERMWCSPK
jgi:hypothetical protein